MIGLAGFIVGLLALLVALVSRRRVGRARTSADLAAGRRIAIAAMCLAGVAFLIFIAGLAR